MAKAKVANSKDVATEEMLDASKAPTGEAKSVVYRR